MRARSWRWRLSAQSALSDRRGARALSRAAGDDRRPVRARRRQRHRRAHHPAAARRRARPAGRGREPRRRRRQYRASHGSRARGRTATRCCWRRIRSRSIRASTTRSPTIRSRISSRSPRSASSRSCSPCGRTSGINTLQELIARAKEKPGSLNYATPGPGTLAASGDRVAQAARRHRHGAHSLCGRGAGRAGAARQDRRRRHPVDLGRHAARSRRACSRAWR